MLATAEANVLTAVANDTAGLRARQQRQYAEQDLLLVRLAADGGARRGELAALSFGDRDGRVLHISRAVSAGEVGSTKARQARTLTLGASTARLWEILESPTARQPTPSTTTSTTSASAPTSRRTTTPSRVPEIARWGLDGPCPRQIPRSGRSCVARTSPTRHD